MKVFRVRLDNELEQKLLREADLQGKTKSEIARVALTHWLSSKSPPGGNSIPNTHRPTPDE